VFLVLLGLQFILSNSVLIYLSIYVCPQTFAATMVGQLAVVYVWYSRCIVQVSLICLPVTICPHCEYISPAYIWAWDVVQHQPKRRRVVI